MNPGSNVAVPPPPAFASIERGRSNSAVVMTGRLRAASEMQKAGVISKEEKQRLKQMILQSDPEFKAEFDKARKNNDLGRIKELLRKNDLIMQDSTLPDMTDMSLDDVDDFSSFLDGLDDPFGSGGTAMPPPGAGGVQYRHSVGFGSEFGFGSGNNSRTNSPTMMSKGNAADGGNPGGDFTRKRQASRSMPSQGVPKIMASSNNGGVGTGATTTSSSSTSKDSNVNDSRRPSRPIDLHQAQQNMFMSSMHAQQRSSGVAPQIKQEPPSFKSSAAVTAQPNNIQIKQENAYKQQQQQMMHQQQVQQMHQQHQQRILQHQQMMQQHYNNAQGMGTPSQVPQAPSHAVDEEARVGIAKSRKNERERKRRLAVSQGFDKLYKLLKTLEEEQKASGETDPKMLTILATSKLDKASILRTAIEKIGSYETNIERIRSDNDRLRKLIQERKGGN